MTPLQRIKTAGDQYFSELSVFIDDVEEIEASLRASNALPHAISTEDGRLHWNGRRIMLEDRPIGQHKHPVRYRMRGPVDLLLEEIASVMETLIRQEKNQ